MSYVLTLVASDTKTPVTQKHFKEIGIIFDAYNLSFTGKMDWLDKDKAANIGISDKAQFSLISHLRDFLADDKIDFFITHNEHRTKKLLLADMDSTIVTGETLDEMAGHIGLKDQIAEITAKAMNGELDFHDAIRERVGLLKELPYSDVLDTLEHTGMSEGAQTFVQTMRTQGATCVLVSGGFTVFTNAIAEKCGFHFNHGNTLEVENDKLTGKVKEPILDKFAKVEFLKSYMKDLNLEAADCLTIGDGANDIPMLKIADLGIGYKPKEAVKKEIGNCIIYGDLTAALYAQGYNRKMFQIGV
ncbi:MAG: phosphoserine phosphatase SerB [Alphaproteobacteria bacterium]|nr:phosphoserine phosphatase SerB [Alphaproteobacteria bacterium]